MGCPVSKWADPQNGSLFIYRFDRLQKSNGLTGLQNGLVGFQIPVDEDDHPDGLENIEPAWAEEYEFYP